MILFGFFLFVFLFSQWTEHRDTTLIQILAGSTWAGGVLKAFKNGIHAADLFHMATIATGSEPVQLPSSSKLPLRSLSSLNTVTLAPGPLYPMVPVATHISHSNVWDWSS